MWNERFEEIVAKEGIGMALRVYDSKIPPEFWAAKNWQECIKIARAFFGEDCSAWGKSRSKEAVIKRMLEIIETASLDDCLEIIGCGIDSCVFTLSAYHKICEQNPVIRCLIGVITLWSLSEKNVLAEKLGQRIENICLNERDCERVIPIIKEIRSFDNLLEKLIKRRCT